MDFCLIIEKRKKKETHFNFEIILLLSFKADAYTVCLTLHLRILTLTASHPS